MKVLEIKEVSSNHEAKKILVNGSNVTLLENVSALTGIKLEELVNEIISTAVGFSLVRKINEKVSLAAQVEGSLADINEESIADFIEAIEEKAAEVVVEKRGPGRPRLPKNEKQKPLSSSSDDGKEDQPDLLEESVRDRKKREADERLKEAKKLRKNINKEEESEGTEK